MSNPFFFQGCSYIEKGYFVGSIFTVKFCLFYWVPASTRFLKFIPFTTLPFSTSRQGIILTLIILNFYFRLFYFIFKMALPTITPSRFLLKLLISFNFFKSSATTPPDAIILTDVCLKYSQVD